MSKVLDAFIEELKTGDFLDGFVASLFYSDSETKGESNKDSLLRG